MTKPLLEYKGISKSFGGVHALKHVSFAVNTAEIHGLVGANGAGKSTLIKITGGVFSPSGGYLIFDGHRGAYHSPLDAEQAGIRIVHQEIPICKDLTIAENIFLGPVPPHHGLIVDRKEMRRLSTEILGQLGISLEVQKRVSLCNAAERQIALIAKALVEQAKLVIMDEPTTALSDVEVERLFGVLKKLKRAGTTFLFVSHRLNEVVAICDRITVLRNGEYINTLDNIQHNISSDTLAHHIIGTQDNSVAEKKVGKHVEHNEVILEAKDLSQAQLGLRSISFKLYRGEILGLTGLRGAGYKELLKCLFGIHPPTSGTIIKGERSITLRSPWDAISNGVAFLSESRSQQIFYSRNILFNISTSIIDKLQHLLFIKREVQANVAKEYVRKLQITPPSIYTEASSLSGGNQQKVLFSSWLALNPSVLLLDEPLHGIDVGTKIEMRRIILDLADNGVSVIYSSQDSEDLSQLVDRVLVMMNGQIARVIRDEEVTAANIIETINELSDIESPTAAIAE